MKTSDDSVTATPWKAPSGSKAKNTVQRMVTALLDELAPERVLKRGEELRVAVEQHRTPNGCVLQAENAALSVSWFTGSGNDPLLGELRIVVWRGVVTRRGAPRRKEGATVVREVVCKPIEDAPTERVWRDSAGAEYSTIEMARLCTKLLDEQIRVA